MNSHFLSTLGLAMRAGKLTFGFDTVKAAVQAGQVFLLMTGEDLSPKTVKETRFLAESQQIPWLSLPITMDGIAAAIGKKTGVIAITEEGLAARLKEQAAS